MNDEDCDWKIYHLIPESGPITLEELSLRSGFSSEIIASSLSRLERYCLISCSGSSVRMLSFGEALIQNQITHDKDLPYTIENGVIRARKV